MTRTATIKKSKLNIKPLADRLIVAPMAADEMTPGGIVLPAAAQEKQQRGTVVALGDGRTTDAGNTIPIANLAIGNEVLYSRYAGVEFELDGAEYMILREADILAVKC